MMKKQHAKRLEFFVNLFNNLFYRKKLIILIGKKNITFSALKKHKVINSMFIKFNDKNFQETYRLFLKKHKDYPVIFLLDDQKCKLKHETMPLLGSIIEHNPVESFIKKNFKPTDLVAYNIYDITNKNGEVWSSCIASMPYVFPFSEILEYIINNSFNYSGIYFLSLEFEPIINKILQKTNNTDCDDKLQIFATLTRSSDIRIAVKYKKNILDEQMVDYPNGKSDMYIQGTIEQSINDKLIYYKTLIDKLKLETCVITLSDSKLKKLLEKLKFDNCQTIAISSEDIISSKTTQKDNFQDNNLIEIFDKSCTHLGLNEPLHSITKLTLINNILFKPVIAIIIGLLITLSTIKYNSYSLQKETSQYNQEYYLLSEEYRTIQKNRPELKKANNLIELYNLETLINKTPLTPFDHIKAIFAFDTPNIQINNVSWKIDDSKNILTSQNKLTIKINYQYEGQRSSESNGTEITKDYYNRLKPLFVNQKVEYDHNPNEIIEIAKKIIVPAEITIKGNIEIKKNAK